MSKAKIIAGAGIIAAGAALSGLPEPNAAKAESPEQTAKENYKSRSAVRFANCRVKRSRRTSSRQ